MTEVARNVDAVRARHAVLAAGAGDKRILAQAVSDFFEKFHIVLGERHKRRVGSEVVPEVFHIGHSAQYSQHILRSAGKAERPRRHAFRWHSFLEFIDNAVRELRERASAQRFHNHDRNSALLKFPIHVVGVAVPAVGV